MFCSRCGTQVDTSSRFCPSCGLDLSSITSAGQQGATARMAAPPEDEASIVREGLKEEYELEQELGRGGMAIVFKARDKQLEREVAIKVLPFSLSFDAEFVERFQREARTAGKLEHPNIIPIYRVGRSGRVIYFVMKYIRGKSLSDVIETRGALPVPEIKRLLIEATRALGYAHKHGIVHRDIKPDNIMFDELGQAIVTDFGIAKAQSGAKLTGTGMSIGTPHYMSPEQARAQNLDGRSDIYSLGVVGYQCLTGHVPFDGEDSFSIGYKHIMEELPVPALEQQDQRDLFAVVQKMMAKKPEDRFQNAEELILSLEGGSATPMDLSTMPTSAIDPEVVKAAAARHGPPKGPPMAAQPTTPLPRASASMARPKPTQPERVSQDTAKAPPPAPPRPRPEPVVEEKRSSKLPVFLAAILLVAFAGTGWYYVTQFKPQQEAARLRADSLAARQRRQIEVQQGVTNAQAGRAVSPAPAVVVRDGYDQPVAFETVRAVVTGDSVRVQFDTALTDSAGRATFPNLTLVGPEGSYPIAFQVGTTSVNAPVPIALAAASAGSDTRNTTRDTGRTRPPPVSRDSGTISVAVARGGPTNVRILLDGTAQSRSRFKAPVGRHALRVEADGYQPYTSTVTVRTNQTLSVTANMRAAATRTDTATTRTVDCSSPTVSTSNPRRQCWDQRPVPRTAPRLPVPQACTGNVTPADVLVHVSTAGEVLGSPAVNRRSNCDAFNLAAQSFALDMSFRPATKGGQAVAAWTLVRIQPVQR